MYAEMYADKIKKARKPYISTKVTGIAGLQGVLDPLSQKVVRMDCEIIKISHLYFIIF